MNWKDNIEDLQEKFWNGDTTLEEEKLLRSYHLEQDEDDVTAHYFNFLTDEANISFNPKKKAKTLRMRARTIYSIAASFAILVTAFLLMQPRNSKAEVYLAQSPEEALEITQNALAIISDKVNRSNDLIFDNLNEYNKINFIK